MGAVRLATRSLLRQRLWGTVAVAMLVALATAAVLGALAGARRTETAYPRLLDATHAPDATVEELSYITGFLDPAVLRTLPHVVRVGGITGFGLAAPGPDGRPNLEDSPAGIASDGVALYDVERPVLSSGRLPRRDRADEVVLNAPAARRLRLRTGDRIRVFVFSLARVGELGDRLEAEGREPTDAEIAATFEPVTARVVGVASSADEIVRTEAEADPLVVFAPAFLDRHPDVASWSFADVRLDDPDSFPAFAAAARARYPDRSLDLRPSRSEVDAFARSVGPYADALRLFALVAGLTALLVVGQAIIRMAQLDARDAPTLRALGMGRGRATLVASGRAGLAVMAGVSAGAVAAAVASPLFPIGPARAAELDDGIRLDARVLAVGFLAALALFATVALVAAWRATRSSAADRATWRPSALAERAGRAGLGPTASTGVRFAFQRDRSGAAPSPVTTLVGVVVAVATITGAIGFGASLDRLVGSPPRWGWTWTALLDAYDNPVTPKQVARLRADHAFDGVTVGARGSVTVEGRPVTAFGFRTVRGDAAPRPISGRMPGSAGEVALGPDTADELHARVGDVVRATRPDGREVGLRVVGVVPLPSLSLDSQGLLLGTGAALTIRGLAAAGPGSDPSFVLVDVRSGASLAAIAKRYERQLGLRGPVEPREIRSYRGVEATPALLAALLALLGAGVLGHALATSVRARRRDLAVLATVGFTRRQVSATVAWQATATALVGASIGIALGVGFGRWLWATFVDRLGLGSGPVVPLGLLALLGVGALVVANVVAFLPARAAARTRPAVVLRSE